MNASTGLRMLSRVVTCGMLAAAPAFRLSAQQPTSPTVTQQGTGGKPDVVAPAGAHQTARRPPIFASRHLFAGIAFTTAAAAFIPADARIANEFQRPSVQSSAALRAAADGVEMVASPGALVFAGPASIASSLPWLTPPQRASGWLGCTTTSIGRATSSSARRSAL